MGCRSYPVTKPTEVFAHAKKHVITTGAKQMSTYMDTVRSQSEAQSAVKFAGREIIKSQSKNEWAERLTPLEDRLSKLLTAIPHEVKEQGLSLNALRNMLAGKWRGKCHPGELGAALRKLGYQRQRNWSNATQSFRALWFPQKSRNIRAMDIGQQNNHQSM